jgi:redox-sensitive bicupin YhaK (pirin superfamily)
MFKHCLKIKNMKTIFYPASERGHVNFGWLNSFHSFSFGHYYDPSKVHFGALRVLNDDQVRGGGGFGTHPHDNMEIVSIPLQGELSHKDSIGTQGLIKTGDVQIMSAGSGIQHSEMNASKTDPVSFLQIWVFPKKENIDPRYDQKTFDLSQRINKWQVIVSPEEKEGGVWINQDARFALLKLEKGKSIDFESRFSNSGIYLFLIDGMVEAGGRQVSRRDAIGISETDKISISANEDSEILAIEVPMLS